MANKTNEIKTESETAKKVWEQSKKEFMGQAIEKAFKIPKTSSKSLGDSIPGNPKIESKLKILHYFRFFLSLASQIHCPYAKRDFKNQIFPINTSTQIHF